MAQLILTCCKREQAEQSWVCGLVFLANVSTSLAQPCCAHRLTGSEAVVQSAGMFPLSLFLSLHPLSSLHQYLYPLCHSHFLNSLFIASPFPALPPKRMMYSIVQEWRHRWQANESLQFAKNGACFSTLFLAFSFAYLLQRVLFYPLGPYCLNFRSIICTTHAVIFIHFISLCCSIATLAQTHCSPCKPSSNMLNIKNFNEKHNVSCTHPN